MFEVFVFYFFIFWIIFLYISLSRSRSPAVCLSLYLFSAAAKRVLATVGNVEEAVLVLKVRVDLAHGRRRLRYGLVDEQEDGLLRRQLDAFAYDPHELGDRDVVGHQKFALVNLGYLRVGHSFDDDRYAIGIFGADLFRLCLSLL